MGLFGFGSDTLYWPGCFSEKYLSDKVSVYKKILKNLGISLRSIEFVCCGAVLIDAGYEKEARKLAREFFEVLKEKGIKRIITSDPLCYKTFSEDYPKMLPDWNIQSDFILNVILEKIKQNSKFLNVLQSTGRIIFHDSCCLRKETGIYEEPRELLKLLGFEVVELSDSANSFPCSGSCSNLPMLNKELSNKLAIEYLKKIKRANISKIITCDQQAYFHLKGKSEALGISIMELSDIFI